MATVNAKSLREERLRRISAAKAGTPAPKAAPKSASAPSKSAPVKPAAKPVVAEAPAAAPVVEAPVVTPAVEAPAAPETLTMLVVDPETLTRSASYELSLYGKGNKNPHWLVVADGHPVAEIQFQDQDASKLSREIFEGDMYGTAVARALSEDEPAKILSSMKARVYASTVKKSDAYAALRTEVSASADTSVKVARAELRDNMLNVIGLVLKAQAKNFIANDLKAEFFDQLQNLGVNERTATFAIEQAWKKAAVTHFEATFKKASEWMDLSPQGYSEIEQMIEGMPEVDAVPTGVVAAASDIPSAAHNVILEPRVATTGPTPTGTDYASVFNFPR